MAPSNTRRRRRGASSDQKPRRKRRRSNEDNEDDGDDGEDYDVAEEDQNGEDEEAETEGGASARRTNESAGGSIIDEIASDEWNERMELSFAVFENTEEAPGKIPVEEVKHAIRSCGLHIKHDEVLSWLPTNKNGTKPTMMTWMRFQRLANVKLKQKRRGELAFGLLDRDGKGIICLEDLERTVAELDDPEIQYTQEDLQEMLLEVATNDDLVTQKDFDRLIRKINL